MLPYWQSNYNFPLSGDVTQDNHPESFFTMIEHEPHQEMEKEIFLNVASYGKQLGYLLEAVLLLVDELEAEKQDQTAFSTLAELRDKIEDVKLSKQRHVKENAEYMLEKLKSTDREAFDSLMKKYRDS